jgi:DNA-binding NtrC family response regulator
VAQAAGLILVVDDQAPTREALVSELREAGFEVLSAGGGAEAWELFRRRRFDLVVSDIRMPNGDGFSLLQRIHGRRSPNPDVPVFLVSAYGSNQCILRAGQLGAREFLALDEAGIAEVVRRARVLLAEGRVALPAELVGESPGIRRIRTQLSAAASLEVPILLEGEPGSGRGAAARYLHRLGMDAAEPLVTVRCGVDEREGAPRDRWVYLANVERLAARAQERWRDELRAKETGKPAVARVLASTAVDLFQLTSEGKFDAELWQRLGRFTVRLPSLSERPQDFADLCEALTRRAQDAVQRHGVQIGARAVARLRQERWREGIPALEHVIRQLVAFYPGGTLGASEVDEILEAEAGSRAAAQLRAERARLETLYREAGSLSSLADRLGTSRNGARYRLEKFGLYRPGDRSRHDTEKK